MMKEPEAANIPQRQPDPAVLEAHGVFNQPGALAVFNRFARDASLKQALEHFQAKWTPVRVKTRRAALANMR
jgi:hypothetical protein